jgi:diguanylate cyclase (GGDEF)-like protein
MLSMPAAVYQVLSLTSLPPELATSEFGPFSVQVCHTLDTLAQRLAESVPDVLVVDLESAGGLTGLGQWSALGQARQAGAFAVLANDPSPAVCTKLLSQGVTDVLDTRAATPAILARRLWLALQQQRAADQMRRALSLDLNTGLPHEQQLLEHMSQLLALREREPASMALIVLHLDGFQAAEVQLGAVAGQSLRRKAAVRLRAGLRASDVVASLGNDSFAVLLAWIDNQADGERVARKLLKSLSQPFQVAGQTVPVGARIGVSQYPEHGRDAATLLQQALQHATGGGLSRLASPAANDE